MIKFIKDILFFLLFTVMAYVVMVIIWGEYIPNPLRPNLKGSVGKDDYSLVKYREMKEIRDLDILFVGSSHAYRTFDSRIWERKGYHVYNIGTSSQTHIHTGLLLRKFVPTAKPKVVIYEVYPDIFSNEGIESNSIFLAYGMCKEGMTAVALKSGNIKTINEWIYAQYRSFTRPNEILQVEPDTTIEIYRSNGFIEILDGTFQEKTMHTPGKIKSHQLQAFYDNMEFLETNGVSVVLVYAPVTKVEYGRFSDQNKYDEIMSNFENYIDFNKLDILEDTVHFYDYHHLNQNGVEVFNPIFIDWFVEVDIL